MPYFPSSTGDRIQVLVCGKYLLYYWSIYLTSKRCLKSLPGDPLHSPGLLLSSWLDVIFISGHSAVAGKSGPSTCEVSGRMEGGKFLEALMFFTEAWKEWRVLTEIAKENRMNWAPVCQLPLYSCLECCSPRYLGLLPHLCGEASLTRLFKLQSTPLHSTPCFAPLNSSHTSFFFRKKICYPTNML